MLTSRSSSDVRVELKADGDGTGNSKLGEEEPDRFCRLRDSRQGEKSLGRAGVILKLPALV